MSKQVMVKRALLSVTDKGGLVEFAKRLSALGVELISTGGTAKALREAGLTVKDISDLTGFPEMLDGRVKTLHPKVHGGLLHVRSNPEHVAAVREHGIEPIDMVVVNLYAFEKTAAKPGVLFDEIVENIDIGGPSMVRSAAKNFRDVAIVTDVADYAAVADELEKDGELSLPTKWNLAKKAFATTAAYDTAIANTLESLEGPSGAEHAPAKVAEDAAFPSALRLNFPLRQTLRYGENPHQGAALYTDGSGTGVANGTQLQGKELSFNNLVDLDACWELVREFAGTAVAIIKHTNPCGAAEGTRVLEAYKSALEADPVSAFGGVIGVNREVDGDAAEEIAKLFVEAVVAPKFSEAARAKFAAKKNLRLVEIVPSETRRVIKQVSGGALLQDADRGLKPAAEWEIVTERKPTAEEQVALDFAWRVCKHVKSNAIVYARTHGGFGQTVGVGAGQMSRVDAAKFGAVKATLPLAGTVAASDAFFPFPDGLEAIAAAGATAIVQPGGSVNDAKVIEAANRLGVAMAFTGMRHFRHG